jgi:MerR family mercuric resistance operon transcriptional regulator
MNKNYNGTLYYGIGRLNIIRRYMMKKYTIGQMAKLADVNIQTIRFYERKGILPKPDRRPSGYRIFMEEDVKRLKFILLSKSHGFSLVEIKELLDLRIDSKSSCDEVRTLAEKKVEMMDAKIKELQSMKGTLLKLIVTCRDRKYSSDCPILEAFDK